MRKIKQRIGMKNANWARWHCWYSCKRWGESDRWFSSQRASFFSVVVVVSENHLRNSPVAKDSKCSRDGTVIWTVLWNEHGQHDYHWWDDFLPSLPDTIGSHQADYASLGYPNILAINETGNVSKSGRLNSLRPSDAYMRRWTNHHWFR